MTEHRPFKTGCIHCNPPTYYGDNIQKVFSTPIVDEGLDYFDKNPPIELPHFSLPSPLVITPWGEYFDYYRSETTVVKRLLIRPGQRFSYQYHNYRDEFWSIESGEGLLTLNNEVFKVGPRFSVKINKLDKHRLGNIGETDLVFFEIQSGKCSEEDIVRLSDDYGR